jgi:chromate reductase
LVVVGSLRRGSYNRLLARAASELAPDDVSFTFAAIGDVPVFNADIVAEHGHPPAVRALREAFDVADGVLVVSPEYNHSVPGGLKNVIDWVSDGSDHPFPGKPMAILGASTGRFGTVRMQRHLRDILTGLGALVMPKPEVTVAGARNQFDDSGRLVDERSVRQVTSLMAAFRDWIAVHIPAW